MDFVLAIAGIIPNVKSTNVLAKNERARELDVVLTICPIDIKQAGINTKRPILRLCAAKYRNGISAEENNIQPATRMNTRVGD
jgi:hypothetical protein